MDNVKIAYELVRLAKSLSAGPEPKGTNVALTRKFNESIIKTEANLDYALRALDRAKDSMSDVYAYTTDLDQGGTYEKVVSQVSDAKVAMMRTKAEVELENLKKMIRRIPRLW